MAAAMKIANGSGRRSAISPMSARAVEVAVALDPEIEEIGWIRDRDSECHCGCVRDEEAAECQEQHEEDQYRSHHESG
jgi:hypothetical protein